MKTILVSTDFSKAANNAVQYAAKLAAQQKAKLILINAFAIPLGGYDSMAPMESISSIKDYALKELTKLMNEILNHHKHLEVECSVELGNPVVVITDLALQLKPDLIVMGTHGYSAWEDLTIGSNALKVITKSPCPVLTMSQFASNLGYHKIILPIDTSEHSRHKVVLTIELAKQFTAQIFAIGLLSSDEGSKKPAMEVMLHQVETAAAKAGVVCKTELRENVKNRAVETVNYCEKMDGDLISIMTDQDNEISGFFLGNYALQVIHHSKVPVLSIKPEEHPENVSYSMLSGT